MDEIQKREEEFKKLRDTVIVQVVDLPGQDTVIRVGKEEEDQWKGTIFANSVQFLSYMDPVANQPGFFSAQVQVYSEVEFWVEFLTGTEGGKEVVGTVERRYCGQVRFFASNGSEEEHVTLVAFMNENWTAVHCSYRAIAGYKE